jgi:hypothetical protein
MTPEKLWARTRTTTNGCMEWTGYVRPNGYGRTTHEGKSQYPHRLAFLFAHGRLPLAGYEVDHVCRNRKCVAPDHLREVTRRENMANGARMLATHCPSGHPYTPENTWLDVRRGCVGRTCRTCHREREAARKKRIRG